MTLEKFTNEAFDLLINIMRRATAMARSRITIKLPSGKKSTKVVKVLEIISLFFLSIRLDIRVILSSSV